MCVYRLKVGFQFKLRYNYGAFKDLQIKHLGTGRKSRNIPVLVSFYAKL